MQHKAFLGFAFESFQALHVVAGAEGRCDQSLRFPSGENGAAVSSWQDTGFDPDVTDFVEGARIWTPFLVDHLLAEDPLPKRLVILREFLLGVFVFFVASRLRQLCGQALLDVLDHRVAFRFGMLLGIERVRHFGADAFLQIAVVRLIEHRRLDLALGLSDFIAQLVNRRADFLDLGVPELDGVHDRLFFDFLRARLDHHDAIGSSDDHDVDQTSAHLVIRGIHDELSIDQADAHGADGTEERNVGKGQCTRRAVDAQDIGIIIAVGRQHEGNDLRLALEALGEHRTHGPVDLATGEHFALAHAAFALDEAAGKASTGVGVFAVIDGEGKEINAFAGIGVGGGGGEHNIFAEADNSGAAGLLGQLSRFK